jgi:hypothetical protein
MEKGKREEGMELIMVRDNKCTVPRVLSLLLSDEPHQPKLNTYTM